MYEKPFENNELMHYGILGMKWGLRRYRNPDGTLTEEGKRRYGDSKPESGRYPQGEGKLGTKPAKRASDLDDSELDKAIKRLQMEETYANLVARKKDRETPFMKKVVSNTLSKLGEKLTGKMIDKVVDKVTGDSFDINDYRDTDFYDLPPDKADKVLKWYEKAGDALKVKNRLDDDYASKRTPKPETKPETKSEELKSSSKRAYERDLRRDVKMRKKAMRGFPR